MDEEVNEMPQQPMPVLPLAERRDGFCEVELGYTAYQAVREAGRCLRCDIQIAEEMEEEDQAVEAVQH